LTPEREILARARAWQPKPGCLPGSGAAGVRGDCARGSRAHVCAQMLSAIVYALRDKTVDAVLFLDRLDSYRVDASDVQARAGPRSRGLRALSMRVCAEACARLRLACRRERARVCWVGAGDRTGRWVRTMEALGQCCVVGLVVTFCS